MTDVTSGSAVPDEIGDLRKEDVVVVVPTIRRENIREFFDAWGDEFAGVRGVVVVEDNPEPTFDLGGSGVTHVAWSDIDAALGKDGWIVPRRTDCVRSYGYLKALELGAGAILTLDDDCFPGDDPLIEGHLANLNSKASSPAWLSTLDGVVPRGVPYETTVRRASVGLSHGLWTNVPDYDAISQLVLRRHPDVTHSFRDVAVPRGMYFPMCGMNLAWRAELTPVMYFLLMGLNEPFDRFGDIWCGVLAKRVLDHLGLAAVSGRPAIEHRRASNVWTNLRKEAPGLPYNERFWEIVDAVPLRGGDAGDCYRALAQAIEEKLGAEADCGTYWSRLARAMGIWVDLAENRLRAPEPFTVGQR